MNSMLYFLIQSSMALMVFWFSYRILYAKEGFLFFNRYYLLSSAVLSILLPLIPVWSLFVSESSAVSLMLHPVQQLKTTLLSEVVVRADGHAKVSSGMFNTANLIFLIYIIGVVVTGLHLLLQFKRMFNLVVESPHHADGSMEFRVINGKHAFSFFGWIFIPAPMLHDKDAVDTIYLHEKEHCEQRHSWDLLLMEGLRVILWFNPVVYLLTSDIRNNHEWLADLGVLNQRVDKKYYQRLLLQMSRGQSVLNLSNTFSFITIKNRFIMMNNVKNLKSMRLKSISVVFVVLLAAMACSSPQENDDNSASEESYAFLGPVGSEFAADSIWLSTDYNDTDRAATFKWSIGKTEPVRVILYDHDGSVLETMVESTLDKGKYTMTYEFPEEVNSIAYVFTAGEHRLTGSVATAYARKYDVESGAYTVADEMPVFPGGTTELMNYLAKNTTYPQAAKEAGITGRVYINFVVETDGSIADVRVLKGIGGGCDEESVRVVKSMPHWIPGRVDGEPVRVSFNLPIRYTLQ